MYRKIIFKAENKLTKLTFPHVDAFYSLYSRIMICFKTLWQKETFISVYTFASMYLKSFSSAADLLYMEKDLSLE